ncbi:Uncharacterised protein [Salmonella enterica subsp. enterica serovar Thompson]|nr:Uncharacterised protein [Salmonella enterica subsp. enterica serovar Thompson]
MIIRHRLFILNGEFSVSDELFENIMIIIKTIKISERYIVLQDVYHIRNRMRRPILISDKHFIVVAISYGGGITCRELKK